MILGAITAAVSALPLAACRGVGLIDFVPELLPGSFLAEWLNIESGLFEGIVYLACGALLSLIYRQIFKYLWEASWLNGMVIGIFQWLYMGIILALVSDYLPESPLLLPAESPVESVYGIMCFLMIFATSVLYGVALGLALGEEKLESRAELAGEAPETPAAEEIEQRKAA
jgi:hypothetical protein